MKKVLSILLCALMMFMGSAMAASQEITIGNVMFYSGDQVMLDLSGIELKLGLGENEEYAGVMAGLAANGETLVEAVAALGAENILLGMTGISDYYSINLQQVMEMLQAELEASGMSMEDLMGELTAGVSAMQDTAALENIVTVVENIMTTSMADGGTEEIEGVTYQIVTMTVTEEQMDELLKAIVAAVDAYVPEAADGTGYDSLVEAFEAGGMYSSMEGAIYMGDTDVIADFYQVLGYEGEEDEEVIEHYVSMEVLEGETEGAQEMDIWYALYSDYDDFEEPEFSALAMIYTENGEFTGVETLIGPEGEEIYVDVISQQTEGGKLWEVSFGSASEELHFAVGFGPLSATQNCFYVDFYEYEDIVTLAYVSEGNYGQFELYTFIDDEEVILTADVNVSEGDGAWLPANVTESVDILDLVEGYMSEANVGQVEKLSNEAALLLNNVLTSLAQSNEAIGALMGYMG